MAYSNWGARVHCDGAPMPECCDQNLSDILGKTPKGNMWYGILSRMENPDNFMLNSMCHAIVGDPESGILVMLYKSHCEGIYEIVNSPIGFPMLYEIEGSFDCYDEDKTRSYEGIGVSFVGDDDPESISVTFTDRKNRRWNAISGYCIGEGHEDWYTEKELLQRLEDLKSPQEEHTK